MSDRSKARRILAAGQQIATQKIQEAQAYYEETEKTLFNENGITDLLLSSQKMETQWLPSTNRQTGLFVPVQTTETTGSNFLVPVIILISLIFLLGR